jgi:hypothetical protein
MADNGSNTDVQKDRVFILTSLSRCRAFRGPAPVGLQHRPGRGETKDLSKVRVIQRRDRFTENRPAAYDRSGER